MFSLSSSSRVEFHIAYARPASTATWASHGGRTLHLSTRGLDVSTGTRAGPPSPKRNLSSTSSRRKQLHDEKSGFEVYFIL